MQGGVVGRLAAVSIVFGLAACAPALHPPPSPARKTSIGLKLDRFTLANGLRVVVIADPTASEVTVTMRYAVGSIDDPADQAGLAHLVEHLMYQQVLGAKSVLAHLEDDATWFNGETTLDATTYMAHAAPTHLDELLSIEAVRVGLRCASISDSGFERERAVVIDELRQRAGIVKDVVIAIQGGLFPEGHPYHRRQGGTPDSVGAITRAQACAFADAHYAPANAVLVVSGDITALDVQTGLDKFLAKIPARAVVAPVTVVAAPPVTADVALPPQITGSALVIAWPLPPDPRARAIMRLLATTLASAIEDEIDGEVVPLRLGDTRAPMLAMLVIPARRTKLDATLAAARRGIAALPGLVAGRGLFEDLWFERRRQTAIYDAFSALESGGARDVTFASEVLAGADPTAVLGDELGGLRALTRTEAAAVASAQLDVAHASTLRLIDPHAAGPQGAQQAELHELADAPPIHDLGLRRDPPDAALAHQPAPAAPTPTSPPAGAITRTLPNGLRVVLLPVTSVPTIDVRLVFGTGTGDDPARKRGTAQLTADTLTWNLRYLNDMLALETAGGDVLVGVGRDHTTFEVRGLDMHVDLLLAGLRRKVLDGEYDSDPAAVIAARRRALRLSPDDGALTDAWRSALYGADHPYVAAGLVRHAGSLAPNDTDEFRAAHYTPDNATLVIAGRFDAAIANRWIDFLFGTWTGHAVARGSTVSTPTPATLAKAEEGALVHLSIALPAHDGDHARQLVAAAMLDAVADDVRQQLGATYGLGGGLDEGRQSTAYTLGGAVDAPRTHEAIALIRTRLAQLHDDPDAAARAFVTARARVLVKLDATSGSAVALATRAEDEIVMGRAPASASTVATAVRALTIEHMAPALADLQLATAVIAMRGPRADLDAAFAELGRTPTYVTAQVDAEDPIAVPAFATRRHDRVEPADVENAITTPYVPSKLIVALAAGPALGHYGDFSANGAMVSVEALTAVQGDYLVGAHLSGTIAQATGESVTPTGSQSQDFQLYPFDIAGTLQRRAADRLWGGIYAGLHLDDSSLDGWHAGVGAGITGGVEITRGAGVFAQLSSTLVDSIGYYAFTFGVTYRTQN